MMRTRFRGRLDSVVPMSQSIIVAGLRSDTIAAAGAEA